MNDIVLMYLNRLQERRECDGCESWRGLKLKIRRLAEQDVSWKARLHFMLGLKCPGRDMKGRKIHIRLLFDPIGIRKFAS